MVKSKLTKETVTQLVSALSKANLQKKLKIPPFTKAKEQLEKVEVDWSRAVRIHVEQVIGVL